MAGSRRLPTKKEIVTRPLIDLGHVGIDHFYGIEGSRVGKLGTLGKGDGSGRITERGGAQRLDSTGEDVLWGLYRLDHDVPQRMVLGEDPSKARPQGAIQGELLVDLAPGVIGVEQELAHVGQTNRPVVLWRRIRAGAAVVGAVLLCPGP